MIRWGASTVMLVLLALGLRGFYVNVLDIRTGLPAAVSLGFILVASYTFSRLFVPLRLPRITAYLVMGMLCGPDLLGLISDKGVADLRLIERAAIALIALQAGGEIRWADLRKRVRVLLFFVGSLLVVVLFGTIGGFLALVPLMGIFRDAPWLVVLAAAVLMGITAVAKSPATAVAVIKETQSRGPMTETVITVLLILDIVAVILFAFGLGLAESWCEREAASASVHMAAGAPAARTPEAVPVPPAPLPEAPVEKAPAESAHATSVLGLLWQIAGALPLGAVIGLLASLYLRFARGNYLLFVFLLCLLLVEISNAMGIELIMMAVVAGFVVENLSDQGDEMMQAIDRSYLPVYVAFFTLAGASVKFDFLLAHWALTLVFVVLIGSLTWGGSALGGKLGNLQKPQRHYVFTGLLAQAGLNISFATMIRDRLTFPLTDTITLGAALQTLILARVAIKQLVGPILFRFALERVGEVAAAEDNP